MATLDYKGLADIDVPDDWDEAKVQSWLKTNSANLDKQLGLTPEASERPGVMSQFGSDIKRGGQQLLQLVTGLGAMGADVVGADNLRDKWLESYVSQGKNIEETNAPIIGSYKNIENVGDFGRYMIEAVGENLPMMLPSLATGGVGAFLAKQGVQKAAEVTLAKFVKEGIAKGLTKEAAEKAAAKQTADMITKAITKGGIAGAAPAAIGMEQGNIYGDIYKETGEKAPYTAAAYGAAAGSLDILPQLMVLNRLFGPAASRAVSQGLIKRLGVEGAKQFVAEGGTEGLQTVIERAAVASKDPSKEVFSPEGITEIIDSALKGGIGGAVVGMGSEAFSKQQEEAKKAVPDAPQLLGVPMLPAYFKDRDAAAKYLGEQGIEIPDGVPEERVKELAYRQLAKGEGRVPEKLDYATEDVFRKMGADTTKGSILRKLNADKESLAAEDASGGKITPALWDDQYIEATKNPETYFDAYIMRAGELKEGQEVKVADPETRKAAIQNGLKDMGFLEERDGKLFVSKEGSDYSRTVAGKVRQEAKNAALGNLVNETVSQHAETIYGRLQQNLRSSMLAGRKLTDMQIADALEIKATDSEAKQVMVENAAQALETQGFIKKVEGGWQVTPEAEQLNNLAFYDDPQVRSKEDQKLKDKAANLTNEAVEEAQTQKYWDQLKEAFGDTLTPGEPITPKEVMRATGAKNRAEAQVQLERMAKAGSVEKTTTGYKVPGMLKESRWVNIEGDGSNKGFYSQAAEMVRQLPMKSAPIAQWISTIANQPGVKPEEVKWFDFSKFHNRGKVTKEELLEEINMQTPKLFEDTTDRYGGYTLPGGKNYRVILFKWLDMPEVYKGGHFSDDVLIHARVDDRVVDGKKTLFINEIQSDIYKKKPENLFETLESLKRDLANAKIELATYVMQLNNLRTELSSVERELGKNIPEYASHWRLQKTDIRNQIDSHERVIASTRRYKAKVEEKIANYKEPVIPPLPFKSSWTMLALKALVRHAAEQGYDYVAWPSTKEQVGVIEQWPESHLDDPRKQGIIRRITQDLRQDANKFFKKFGVQVQPLDLSAVQEISWSQLSDAYDSWADRYVDKIILADNRIVKTNLINRLFNLGELYIKENDPLDIQEAMEGITSILATDFGFLSDAQQETFLNVLDEFKDLFQGTTVITEKVQGLEITDSLRNTVIEKGLPLWKSSIPVKMKGKARVQELNPRNPAFRKKLENQLKKYGLSNVALNFFDKIYVNDNPVAGYSYNKTIALAMEEFPELTMQHEVIHALKDAGMFTDSEWNMLVEAARANGDQHGILKEIDKIYAEYPQAIKDEELVAELYRQWYKDNRLFQGPVARLLQKIKDFLAGLKSLFKNSGFKNSNEIFSNLAAGGFRKRQVQNATRLADDILNPSFFTNDILGVKAKEDLNIPNRLGLFSRYVMDMWHIAAKNPYFGRMYNTLDKIKEKSNQLVNEQLTLLEPYNKAKEGPRRQGSVGALIDRVSEQKSKVVDGRVTIKNNSKQAVGAIEPGQSITLEGEAAQVFEALQKWGDWRAQEIFKSEMDRMRVEKMDAVERDKKVKKLSAELAERLKTTYVPLGRLGNHMVVVKDKAGNTVYAEGFDTSKIFKGQLYKEMVAKKNELTAKYPHSGGYTVTDYPMNADSIQKHMKPDLLESLDSIIELLTPQEIEASETLREKMAKLSRDAYKPSFLKKSENIPGFSLDLDNVIHNSVLQFSGWSGRNRWLEDVKQNLANAAGTGKDYDSLKAWTDEFMSPMKQWDDIKNIGFLWYLTTPSAALLNLFQLVPAASFTHMYAPATRVPIEMARALKDAFSMLSMKAFKQTFIDFSKTPKDFTEEEMRDLYARGISKPVNTVEQAGLKGSGVKNKFKLFTEVAALPFSVTENIARTATYIANRRLLKNDMTFNKAMRVLKDNEVFKAKLESMGPTPTRLELEKMIAEHATKATQFDMGPISRPPMLRGPGGAIFQFSQYPIMALGLMADFYRGYGSAGKKALTLFLLSTLITSGIWGLPLGDNLKDVLEKVWEIAAKEKISLNKEAENLFKDIIGKEGTEALMHGVLRSALGVDIGQRVGYGQAPFVTQLLNMMGVGPGKPTDAFGVPFALTAGNIIKSYPKLEQGDYAGAAAIMLPTWPKNVFQAIQWQDKGVPYGDKQILMAPQDVSKADMLKKAAFSMEPVSVARARETVHERKVLEDKWSPLRNEFYSKLGKIDRDIFLAKQRGDMSLYNDAKEREREVFKEIVSHNRKAKSPLDIIKIMPKTRRDNFIKMTQGLEGQKRILPRKVRSALNEEE